MIEHPLYKSVPTYRNYDDYIEVSHYIKGWNDAMDFIFPEHKKVREKEKTRKKLKEQK